MLTDGRLYFSAPRRSAQGVSRPRRPRHQAADGSRRARWRRSAVAARRRSRRACANCGVPHVVQGCSDKVAGASQASRERSDIDPLNCACIVDDTPDLPLMSAVGFAAAVADAHPVVLAAAHWVRTAAGGRGRGARTVRRHAAARPRPRPNRRTLNAVSNLHRDCGRGAGDQHLDIEFPGRRPAVSPEAQQADLPGYYLEERRAHRL